MEKISFNCYPTGGAGGKAKYAYLLDNFFLQTGKFNFQYVNAGF